MDRTFTGELTMDNMLSKALREFMTGSLKQLIVNLGGEDGERWEEELKRFNRKEPCWVKSASALLGLISEVVIPVTKKFLARDHFTTDSKGVKFCGFGSNFEDNFMGKVEEAQIKTAIRISRLKKNSLDKPIVDELKGEAETTLANIWKLLENQPNGEFGKLLVNTHANIFYVRDAKGVLWAVSVRWFGDGWRVYADSVTYPHVWTEGSQVFSHNS